MNKKKSIVNTNSDSNLCTHIERNDLQGLLIEVEMLKCELDSNQEALSRYRRANTILKRDAHSADHISKSEKCFDTQSQSCQVNIDETNSLAKMKDEAQHIAEAKIKQLELCESSIFENVKNWNTEIKIEINLYSSNYLFGVCLNLEAKIEAVVVIYYEIQKIEIFV